MNYYSDTLDSPLGTLHLTSDGLHLTGLTLEKQGETYSSHALLEKAKEELSLYFQGKLEHFTIPCLLQGTEFQRSAWSALLQIPYGETRSYEEQACAIGNTKAVRAVGGANKRNPISIIIPCHRVIGKNATLTGYGGELWRKEWLLTHEKKYKK